MKLISESNKEQIRSLAYLSAIGLLGGGVVLLLDALVVRGGMGGLQGDLVGRVTLGSLGVTTAYDFGGRGGMPNSARPGEEHCSYRWNFSTAAATADDEDDEEEDEDNEEDEELDGETCDGETGNGDLGNGETGDGFRSPVCRLGVTGRFRGWGRTGTGSEEGTGLG